MARRKGKSQRRISNWEQRFGDDADMQDTSARRQSLSHRAVKLGSGSFAASADALDESRQCEGMIVGVFRRGAYVRMEGRRLFCGIAKTFRAPEGSTPLAVGDVVTVAMAPAEYTDGQKQLDRDRMDGMILSRQPRASALSRPRPQSGKRRDEFDADMFEKVIAANMDVLLIVVSTRQPPLVRGLIDRFLIIAERGELEPIVVINKTDLGPADEHVLADLKASDVPVLLCSALHSRGLEALAKAMAGKRSILAGASGVGKSTLINHIIPGADAVTRSIRAKDERGRHATSTAAVYDLPGGGILVDTPGIRELGIPLEAVEVAWYFREFEEFAPRCRFRNCTHTHEPDCAIIAAVEQGDIKARRYDSYLRILDTLNSN